MNRRQAKKILRRDMRDVSEWAHAPLAYSADQFRRALLRVRRDERQRDRRAGRWSPMHPVMRRYCEATGHRMVLA